jgi:hypothetical protein
MQRLGVVLGHALTVGIEVAQRHPVHGSSPAGDRQPVQACSLDIILGHALAGCIQAGEVGHCRLEPLVRRFAVEHGGRAVVFGHAPAVFVEDRERQQRVDIARIGERLQALGGCRVVVPAVSVHRFGKRLGASRLERVQR